MTLDEIRSAFIGVGVTTPIIIGAVDEKKTSAIFIPTQVPTSNISIGGLASYEVCTAQLIYRGTNNYKDTEAQALLKLPQTPVTVRVNGFSYYIVPTQSGFVNLGIQAGAYELVRYYEARKQQ